MPYWKKKRDDLIGLEPNSAVVFHALPRHDKDLPLEEMEEEPLTKEDKWQDDEHRVYNPPSKDPKGREPNSSVVFHALPIHDKNLPLDATEEKSLTKEDKWQDDENLVHPPASKDPKGIVGHLQKD